MQVRCHVSSHIVALLFVIVPALAAATLNKPVLYVTQVPIPDESLSKTIKLSEMNITTTMMSPLADTKSAARGGALWIRYTDGSRRNLTEAAGFGGAVDANHNATGFQGANSIAVMRPFMHWNGTKAIFAMVVGAPTSASDITEFRWQLYEITNFGQGLTPLITRVIGQRADYNNYHPCYDTQNRIIFVSDAPHDLLSNLYPQLDEYMSLPCNTGLWRFDPALNDLKQIIHTPSGVQSPFIDSAGRVIFVQWDHFTRDPQASTDRPPIAGNGDNWTQTFNGNGNFTSEAPGAAFTQGTVPYYPTNNSYPEPRNFDKTALLGTNLNGNALNQFFPWECREDGSSHEVANHAGRHEISNSITTSFTDDQNLVALNKNSPSTTGLNFMQLTESPITAGLFFAVNAVEFGTHAAGPIITYDGSNSSALPGAGRRVLPVPMHDASALTENPPVAGAPLGSVKLGNDGSWAAVLPAGRAMSWHLLDGVGTKSQVKERYWVTFAPGEVRTCAVCHGVNTHDQAGNAGVPLTKPAALYTLLDFWKTAHPPGRVQHSASSASVMKSAGSVTLNVARVNGSTGPVSVQYTTANGSAIAGTDYATSTGVLNWLDGDTAPKPITITLLNPTTIATSKQLGVTLSSPQYASLGNPVSASVTVDEPPFQAWLFTKLGAGANTANGQALSDPDNDGLPNLVEWALNGDPTVNSTAQQPVGSLQSNHLTIAFTRNLSSTATCIVEVSNDILTWTPGSTYGPSSSTLTTAATTDITPAASPPGYTVVRDNLQQALGARRFIRVRVQGP